ncbi:MAG: DNA mismatch repair endonuclease MutL, partial [Planctomycetota bacterium]
MGRIQVLNWLVVNKIAAGEVIERPASVVKELVENAVDAESSQIEIQLEEGGKRLIRVTDDGQGIHPEDLATAFLNHATSKISNVEDIFSIHTMGFRGEALPSIASISKITLCSRIPEAPLGRKVVVQNGICSEVQEEGMAYGTQIDVEDLFYNTPVRQKFLKASKTELSYISKIIALLALAHEHCGFTLIHNQKQLFKIPKNMDLRERIEVLFGKELIEESLPVNVIAEEMQLRAFIGKPSVAKPNNGNSQIYFFLNHRPIKDKGLAQAFREAYSEFLAPNRFPHGFIFLEMKPELVDVNVHPTKSEVRFQYSGKIFSFLLHQFKETLRNSNLAPAVKIPLNPMPMFLKNSLNSLLTARNEETLPFKATEVL